MSGFEEHMHPEVTDPSNHNINMQNYPYEDIYNNGGSLIDDGIYDVSN